MIWFFLPQLQIWLISARIATGPLPETLLKTNKKIHVPEGGVFHDKIFQLTSPMLCRIESLGDPCGPKLILFDLPAAGGHSLFSTLKKEADWLHTESGDITELLGGGRNDGKFSGSNGDIMTSQRLTPITVYTTYRPSSLCVR